MHAYELSATNRNEVAFRRNNEHAVVGISRGSPETAANYLVDPNLRGQDFNAE